MKKLLTVFISIFLLSFYYPPATINKQERKFAINFLRESETKLMDAISGLSYAQMNFKPSPESWSITETLKHIAKSEEGLWKLMDGTIQQPANPEKRSDIKNSDEQLIKMLEDRSHKAKTSEQLEPQNTPYLSATEAINDFRKNREKLIAYVRSTDADLRNHVAATPVGAVDAYQVSLFIGSHSNRHRMQIQEIKENPGFPLE